MIRLYTQRTTFFNSLVTNRALDVPLASLVLPGGSGEQHRLLKRAAKKRLTIDEVYDALQTEGLFSVISGTDI